MTQRFRIYDPLLFGLALLATILGLVLIFDAGYVHSIQKGESGIPSEFKNQLALVPIAAALAWLAARWPVEKWKKWSKLIWLINLILLVAVEIVGHRLNGARRWLGFGVASIQPAEFAKLAAIVYLAGCFADRKTWAQIYREKKSRATFKLKMKRALPALWVALAVVLIEIEPDLGTGAVIAATAFAMFCPGGVSGRSILLALLFVVVGGTVAVYKQPYRLERFIDHPNRWAQENKDDSQFQTDQAEWNIANGGLFGTGLATGYAKRVLPETMTDFILATAAEETGLVGALFLLILMGAIVMRLIQQAMSSADRFSMLVLYGVACWLGVQTCVNVMMANALLPAIGIPFPFISYGGSSLIALWIAIGVCQSAMAPPKPVEQDEPTAEVTKLRPKSKRSREQSPVLVGSLRARGR